MSETNITKRTPEEVAEQIIETYTQEEIIKVILELDYMVGYYPFSFSVIRSLIHAAVEEDGFSKKELDQEISKADLYLRHE